MVVLFFNMDCFIYYFADCRLCSYLITSVFKNNWSLHKLADSRWNNSMWSVYYVDCNGWNLWSSKASPDYSVFCILTFILIITGCKEIQFSNLPFGQAVQFSLAQKILISKISSKIFPKPTGKWMIKSISPNTKFPSPGISDMHFFVCCIISLYSEFLCQTSRLVGSHYSEHP